jgi:hypothetical protein
MKSYFLKKLVTTAYISGLHKLPITEIIEEIDKSLDIPVKRDKHRECYSCLYRGTVSGSAHISCTNPDPTMKGDPHGVEKGWFFYPHNFDPVWKTNQCICYAPNK